MAVSDCITVVISFMIIANQSTNMVNGAACNETRNYKILLADCTDLGLKTIPNDLMKNVQIIDMSYNPVDEIKEDSFKEYPSLLNFTLNGGALQNLRIHPKAFAQIPELRYVKISDCNLSKNPTLFFPSSLTRLFLMNNALNDISISIENLSKLKLLNLANNYFTQIPKFHPNAPLKVLNMSNTLLSAINVTYLANYCLLQILFFDIPRDWEMYIDKNDSCGCLSIPEWLKCSQVKKFENFNVNRCTVNSDSKRCSEDLIKEIMQIYRRCQQNMSTENNSDEYYFYHDDEVETSYRFLLLSIIMSVLIIIVVVIFALMYKKSIRRWKENTTSNSSETDQYNQEEEDFVGNKSTETDEETE